MTNPSGSPSGSSLGDLCRELESMLGVCGRESEMLGRCKGREHAKYMEQLHLSAAAGMLAAFGKGERSGAPPTILYYSP